MGAGAGGAAGRLAADPDPGVPVLPGQLPTSMHLPKDDCNYPGSGATVEKSLRDLSIIDYTTLDTQLSGSWGQAGLC